MYRKKFPKYYILRERENCKTLKICSIKNVILFCTLLDSNFKIKH